MQKWLGHAQLTTTAIYANAVGRKKQSIAPDVVTIDERRCGRATVDAVERSKV